MPRPLVVLLLALLLGLQAVTTDLYLPALPAIREQLGASMGEIQLTLTALLLASVIFAPGCGSDRAGDEIGTISRNKYPDNYAVRSSDVFVAPDVKGPEDHSQFPPRHTTSWHQYENGSDSPSSNITIADSSPVASRSSASGSSCWTRPHWKPKSGRRRGASSCWWCRCCCSWPGWSSGWFGGR